MCACLATRPCDSQNILFSSISLSIYEFGVFVYYMCLVVALCPVNSQTVQHLHDETFVG